VKVRFGIILNIREDLIPADKNPRQILIKWEKKGERNGNFLWKMGQ
jgi:hypothetical protein